MPDAPDTFMRIHPPTPEHPLLGLTVLVVEDSRFACEAMRLLCLRSGARIRRADSLRAARRHLAVYRPVVLIVDLGLPDGSGEELIRELDNARPRVPVILGTSGDDNAEAAARRAGADGFLAKPVSSLEAFRAEVLRHLPRDMRPHRLQAVSGDMITPDPLALRDDLRHAAELLRRPAADRRPVAYLAQFLSGIALLARDPALGQAARRLEACHRKGAPTGAALKRLAALLDTRLHRPHGILG